MLYAACKGGGVGAKSQHDTGGLGGQSLSNSIFFPRHFFFEKTYFLRIICQINFIKIGTKIVFCSDYDEKCSDGWEIKICLQIFRIIFFIFI